MNAPVTAAAIASAYPDEDPCTVVSYTAGGMLTEGRYCNVRQAMRCRPVGRWYPIDAGFRSEDGRELILRDVVAEPVIDRACAAAAKQSRRAFEERISSHPAMAGTVSPNGVHRNA